LALGSAAATDEACGSGGEDLPRREDFLLVARVSPGAALAINTLDIEDLQPGPKPPYMLKVIELSSQ
jgi:hypothetical protein